MFWLNFEENKECLAACNFLQALREAKPGGFQTGGFPTFFSGKVQIVSRTLSGLFLVGALNRLWKRKRTNRENPRTIPEQIGKIPQKSGKPQKGQKRTKKGRTRPDREAPPFETPPFSGPWKRGSMTYPTRRFDLALLAKAHVSAKIITKMICCEYFYLGVGKNLPN